MERSILGKQSRPSASASATSRKNKLQRCSVCGGLGHKSRTCDQQTSLKMGVESDGDFLSDSITRSNSFEEYDDSDDYQYDDDDENDTLAFRAACSLLHIASQKPIDLSTFASPMAPPAYSPPPHQNMRPHWQPYASMIMA